MPMLKPAGKVMEMNPIAPVGVRFKLVRWKQMFWRQSTSGTGPVSVAGDDEIASPLLRSTALKSAPFP